MEFLRDPIWQFVGAVVALVAFVTSVFTLIRQRTNKAISFDVVNVAPLLRIQDEIKDKLQIIFEGRGITEAHLVVLDLYNSGTVPILPQDYFQPVSFDFGDPSETEILNAEILETSPSNMAVSIARKDSTIELEPVLLNPADSIRLKVLLTRVCGKIKGKWRIVGIKEGGLQKAPQPDPLERKGQAATYGGSYRAARRNDGSPRSWRAFAGILARIVTACVMLVLFVFFTSCTTAANQYRLGVGSLSTKDYCGAIESLKVAVANADPMGLGWNLTLQRKAEYPFYLAVAEAVSSTQVSTKPCAIPGRIGYYDQEVLAKGAVEYYAIAERWANREDLSRLHRELCYWDRDAYNAFLSVVSPGQQGAGGQCKPR